MVFILVAVSWPDSLPSAAKLQKRNFHFIQNPEKVSSAFLKGL
jgi:hypothetical protein